VTRTASQASSAFRELLLTEGKLAQKKFFLSVVVFGRRFAL
jgi:hypothetical protein